MKYVLLTDDDDGTILVACPDEAAAESLGAAAIFSDGGVSAWLVPARAVGWDHERVKEILSGGGSLADVEEANLEMSPRQVDSDLTEDEAITESIRLRNRFDWSGTMFVRQDVIDNVRAAWRAHEEDVDDDWTAGAATWQEHGEGGATGQWVGERETRGPDGEISRETEWFDTEAEALQFSRGEGAVHDDGDGRPGNLTAERETELVDEVMDSHTYRKLADRFAELGNELLYDAAASAIKEEEA